MTFPKGLVPKNKGKGEAYKWLVRHASYRNDDCLSWPFSRDPHVGRGRLGYLGKLYWAHRLMCELAHGKPPTPKHQAAHLCGKGHEGCVNPLHLAWQTASENLLDRRRHGTVRSNTNGHRGVLTPEQRLQIRALKGKKTKHEIAKMFGVGYGAVQYWHGLREKRRQSTT